MDWNIQYNYTKVVMYLYVLGYFKSELSQNSEKSAAKSSIHISLGVVISVQAYLKDVFHVCDIQKY